MLETVHGCIVQAFQVDPANRNGVLNVHRPHRFVGRPSASSPERLTNITIHALPGRSLRAKRELYRLLVTSLAAFGVPADCVLVRLIEQPAENFGVRGGVPLCDVELGYPVEV
jgi:hypothetical protein